MPNLYQPKNASRVPVKETGKLGVDLAGALATQELADSQGEVVGQIVKKEQREYLAQETESLQDQLHQTYAPKPGTPAAVISPVAGAPALPKSEFLLELENILADGLGDVYSRMEPGLRSKFKNKGEEVARKIEMVMIRSKVKVKQIFSWIREWLRMIPGVNKFFLEQEAKIKSDRIIAIARG